LPPTVTLIIFGPHASLMKPVTPKTSSASSKRALMEIPIAEVDFVTPSTKNVSLAMLELHAVKVMPARETLLASLLHALMIPDARI